MPKIKVNYQNAQTTVNSVKTSNDNLNAFFSSTSGDTKNISDLISGLNITYFDGMHDYVDKMVTKTSDYLKGAQYYIDGISGMNTDKPGDYDGPTYGGNSDTTATGTQGDGGAGTVDTDGKKTEMQSGTMTGDSRDSSVKSLLQAQF